MELRDVPDAIPGTALTNVTSAIKYCSSAGQRTSTFTYSMDLWDDMPYREAAPVKGKDRQKILILYNNG